MSDIAQVIKESVTGDDIQEYHGGPVFNFSLPPFQIPASYIELPPKLPLYWSFDRDLVLRATIYNEDNWAGAISIACTKMASLAYKIEGDVPGRVKRAQDLFTQAGLNQGWVNFITKHLMDYLLTDNGGFIEVVRAGSSMNSQIIGLVPLDSARCQRTGDPEIPVVYRDLKGRLHELQDYQVISIVDSPDPAESWFGVGHSAASRAYRAIVKLAAIDKYLIEKVTGRRPLSLEFINGMNDKQLKNIIAAADSGADAKGLTHYMGVVVIPVPGDKPPERASIPLAEFPDGFDRKQEFDIGLLTYANSIGLDPQDLQPLTGQNLGTGTQSVVLDDKEKGKGLAGWRQAFTHQMTWNVLPDLVTFVFVEKDFRDRLQEVDVKDKRSSWLDRLVARGIIAAPQALQVLVDEHDLPKEFIPTDETQGTDLTDAEKPQDEAQYGKDVMKAEPQTAPGQPGSGAPQPKATPAPGNITLPVQKEASDARELITQEEKSAADLIREVELLSRG